MLALLALLGQLAIALPHEAEQLVAVLSVATPAEAPASRAVDASSTLHAASQVPATGPHDPALCPICQASALARTSLNSAWIGEAPGPLCGASPLFVFEGEPVAQAAVDATAAPRAPPVRVLPA